MQAIKKNIVYARVDRKKKITTRARFVKGYLSLNFEINFIYENSKV
jgi:hypothetical protein